MMALTSTWPRPGRRRGEAGSPAGMLMKQHGRQDALGVDRAVKAQQAQLRGPVRPSSWPRPPMSSCGKAWGWLASRATSSATRSAHGPGVGLDQGRGLGQDRFGREETVDQNEPQDNEAHHQRPAEHERQPARKLSRPQSRPSGPRRNGVGPDADPWMSVLPSRKGTSSGGSCTARSLAAWRSVLGRALSNRGCR